MANALNAIKEVFEGNDLPIVSATKSQTGHGLGAAGANESIYSLLMLENDFIAKSVNISDLDPGAEGIPIALERKDNAGLSKKLL